MKMNNTVVQEPDFVLDCRIDSDKKSLTAAALVFIYLVILFANLLVLFVILLNHQLQEPMFLNIGALAAIDVANSSNFIPKMLSVLLYNDSVISNSACVTQVALVFYLEVLISLILGLMAYDRYVAVLYPLRYPSIITNKTVFAILLLFNGIGLIDIIPFIVFVKELPYCSTNILPFCFCEYSTLVHIACSDDPKYLLLLSINTVIFGGGPLTLILFSYSRIAHAALKIPSSEGKNKLYSTCVTQLFVVGIEYGPLLFCYVLPAAGVKLSIESYNTMVVVSNIIPPMLNPLIYSFRNQEIKKSIYKLFVGKRTVAQIREQI
ncbi:putative gustatory receptor clone PTE03 [Erpetoichthys calabaricus]|uniref:putative gustatory receptor clone PTE03 n=1 Tax=Erpetoichthys calabaricus TaxID=27687 RepID=UPI0022347020|nr:putative gustatory receptor clone PTE03 [Erpetoichthys calabaricus]